MLPILFALITYLGWGSGDVFTAIGSRKIGSLSMAFWTVIFGFLVSILYIPFALTDLQNAGINIILLNIGLAVILSLAWYLFNRALEISNPTLVGTIGAAFSSLVVVFSIIFLKENITLGQTLAIIATFIGLLLTTLDFKILKNNLKLDKGILFAILTMFLWGIYFTFIKIPIRQIGWYWPSMISLVVMSSLFLIYIKIKRLKIANPLNKSFSLITASTLLTTAGTFSFNFALGIGLSAIVAPIAGAYPTLFVFLSYLVFREPITKQQIFGIIVTLFGVVALGLTGNI